MAYKKILEDREKIIKELYNNNIKEDESVEYKKGFKEGIEISVDVFLEWMVNKFF